MRRIKAEVDLKNSTTVRETVLVVDDSVNTAGIEKVVKEWADDQIEVYWYEADD